MEEIILGRECKSTGIFQYKKKTILKVTRTRRRDICYRKRKPDDYGFEGE